MSNKQGQQTKTGNRESQGKQPHQEETKRATNSQQAAQDSKPGPQPGSQKDKKGKLG